METLPLPLFKGTTINTEPISKQLTYEQSAKTEYYATAIRNKPLNSVKVSTYLPKQYFKPLDVWITNWDGLPFTWQGKVWVIMKYEVNYLMEGKAGSISLELFEVRN